MITWDKVYKRFGEDAKGWWIRFGGKGIIDGLRRKPRKVQFYKIMGVDDEGLLLKPYNNRGLVVLPYAHFDQEAQTMPHREFVRLARD